MKTHRVNVLLGFAILLLAGQACVDPIDTGKDVGLHVAEVQVPQSAPASGPVNVTLTVAVGGCLRFDHIAASKTPGTLTLAARGIEVGTTCPDILLHETHSYTAQGPFTNPLTITVYRPTVDPIVKTVAIE